MATNYSQKISEASSSMGQSSDKAHKALSEIMRQVSVAGDLDSQKIREQVEIVRSALREMRDARNQFVEWSEIIIERLGLAQSQSR